MQELTKKSKKELNIYRARDISRQREEKWSAIRIVEYQPDKEMNIKQKRDGCLIFGVARPGVHKGEPVSFGFLIVSFLLASQQVQYDSNEALNGYLSYLSP